MKKDLLFIGDPKGDMEIPLLYIGRYLYNPVAKTLYIEQGGVWKTVLKVYAEHEGVWKEGINFVGSDGNWI
jgi:hypothetical protein